MKEYVELLQNDGCAEEFLRFIQQVLDCETKEVLQNEKIEHVKSVKAIGRILAKLPEIKKNMLTRQ
jgi:hypothetical protein